MIACNLGNWVPPDTGAGRRRRARERRTDQVYARQRAVWAHPAGSCASARILRGHRRVASAWAPPPRRMISWRAWLTTRPGRPIRWKRSAFMRLAAHPLAQRETLHHGGQIERQDRQRPPGRHWRERSPEGICPAARMEFVAEWTSWSFPQRSRSRPDQALRRRPCGWSRRRTVYRPSRAERLGGKQQLRLVAQRQLAQRFADREKAVIGAVAELCPADWARRRPRAIPDRGVAAGRPVCGSVASTRSRHHPRTAARKASVTSAPIADSITPKRGSFPSPR